MAKKVFNDTYVKAIADSIRSKLGTTDTFKISEMSSKVDSIPTGITPTGELSITANGDYDVAEYATANVNVSGGGGTTYTGSYDSEGLKEIGWTDEDIAYANENCVFWNKEDNDAYKVDGFTKKQTDTSNTSYWKYWNKNAYSLLTNLGSKRNITIPLTINGLEGSTTFNSTFSNQSSLLAVPDWDTSKITNFANCFKNDYGLMKAPNWDTSNSTQFGSMFYNCRSLTKVPAYNLEKATTTAQMFYYCYSLIEVPSSMFNMPNNTDTSFMFNNCYALINIPTISLPKCTTLYHMFDGCGNIRNIILKDLENVTTMAYCFLGCTSLIKATIDELPSCTDISYLLSSCVCLESFGDISLPSVTTISAAFSGDTSLQSVGDINVPVCTDISYVFNECLYITSVGKITAPAATNMAYCFYRCNRLPVIDVSGVKLKNLTSYSNFFRNTGVAAKASDGAYADGIPYVYVQDEEDQTWLLSLGSSYKPSTWTTSNVIVAGSAADTRTS